MKKFATIWERGLAYALDLVLLVPSFFVILLWGGDAHFGRSIVFMVALYWLYNSGLESTFWKGTIGKRIMKIQVVRGEGDQLTLGRALIRNIVKLINFSWIFILISPKKQALHDMAVGTTVVKE
jgi:uncharacterized RDD family membrane protein YckC